MSETMVMQLQNEIANLRAENARLRNRDILNKTGQKRDIGPIEWLEEHPLWDGPMETKGAIVSIAKPLRKCLFAETERKPRNSKQTRYIEVGEMNEEQYSLYIETMTNVFSAILDGREKAIASCITGYDGGSRNEKQTD